MTGMIVLSFALGYPLFMVFAYALYKLLFTPLDRIEEEQKREKAMVLLRARRIKTRKREARHVAHPEEPSPVFGLSDLNPSHS